MTPRQKAGRLSEKADPMKESPSPNTTLSHYLILSQLGAGGMGEVWRARDTRLNREVVTNWTAGVKK